VSRSGATLAAARARRFSRPDASRLSWEVGLPVLIGAAIRKRPRREPEAAAAAFVSTLATARAVGLERRRPLWPWAAWRAVLAAVVLVVRQNRARD
jgi:undecaprenyl-diphosphatase